MNLTDYEKQALAFCNRLEDNREGGSLLDLVHAGLGLATEGAELLDGVVEAMAKQNKTDAEAEAYDRNIIEELGDLCWFAALLCDVRNIDLGQFDISPWPTGVIDFEIFLNIAKLIASAGQLGDLTKKELVYGAVIHNDKYIAELREFFQRLRIVTRSFDNGLTVEKILDGNIAKLSARFPDRVYSKASALNRDKGAEMDALGAATGAQGDLAAAVAAA